MGTTQETLKKVALYRPEKIDYHEPFEQPLPTDKITDARNAVSVSEYVVHEYQSIVPFEGMFAGSDFWNDLPEFLEEYWRKIDEAVEAD